MRGTLCGLNPAIKIFDLVLKSPCINTTDKSQHINFLENTMWTKPSYQNIRLGFEITMYKYNR